MENSARNSTENKNVDAKFPSKPSLVVLGIFFVLWILLAIFAIANGDSSKIFPANNSMADFFDVSRVLTIIYYIFLSGAYSVLVFIAMRYLPNFAYLTLVVFWLPVPVALTLAIVKTNILTVYGIVVSLCSCVLMCNLIGTEWLILPEKILKESCKAILTSPAAILFSVFYYWFTSLFIIFAIIMHFYLDTLTEEDGSYSVYIIMLMIANGIIWLWTFRFIFNVGSMVLTGTYAIWYWNERKKVTCDTVLYCFKLIVRYHLGTIAFTTSFVGGGKIHRKLIKYVIKRFRDKTLNKSLICFFVCNLFDKVVFRVVSFFSLATCMIKGQELKESIGESFELYLKNPRKSLVTIKVIESLLISTPVIISLLMFLSLHYYIDFSGSTPDEKRLILIMVGFIGMGSLFFVLPLLATLYAACNAILLCYVEDVAANDGKPYAMSEDLRKTLDHADPPDLVRNKLFFCTKISSKVNIYRIS